MSIMSASEARANLFGLIEQVNEDAAPVEITSRRGDAVLISRSEFEAQAQLLAQAEARIAALEAKLEGKGG